MCGRKRLYMKDDYVTILRNATYIYIYIYLLIYLFFCTHEVVTVYYVTCMRESQYSSTHSKTRQLMRVRGYLQGPVALPQCGPQSHSRPFGKENNLQRIKPRFIDHLFLIWVTILTELSGSQNTKRTSEGSANSTSLRNQGNYTENVIQPEMRFPFNVW
jgi:hypothetical protein